MRVETFESSDGTRIAWERSGSGPVLVIVGGALASRATDQGLARHLAARFDVVTYDRRGRGDSSDTPPYAADLEVEDLEGLIDAVGGHAFVYGRGTGAVLALRSAADGVAMDALVVHEPPYIVGDARPLPPADLAARVRGMVANARPGDAVERYLAEAAGVGPTGVLRLRDSPTWSSMEAVAATITHDLALMDDWRLPSGRLTRIGTPSAVLDGSVSPAWLRLAAREVAAAIPDAQALTLQTTGGAADAAVIASALVGLLVADG